MSAPPVEHKRLLVPRWRSSSKLIHQADALPLIAHVPHPIDDAEVRIAHSEWLDRQTIERASDVLIAAATVGAGAFLAFGPAEQVLKNQDHVAPALVDLAQRIRHGTASAAPVTSTTIQRVESAEALYRELHDVRQSIREYGRNPFAWLDLALLHTRLGHPEAAERAARTSLGLAPESRLVVRSMARLLLHNNAPEEALQMLRRTSLARHDPWLTGVEISLSDLVGRSPRFKRQGEDLIRRMEGRPEAISELAASLGTNSALHGPPRLAKKYFRLALKKPTENVIAQANWMSMKMPGTIDFDGGLLSRESVHEARTLSAYQSGNWTEVLREAERWLADESFSSRPAVLASFVAGSMIGDPTQTERFARLGLVANPRDEMLRNNLAFALAQGGRLEEASKIVQGFPAAASANQQVYHVATAALIELKMGRVEYGRSSYQRAIELADQQPPGPGILARYHYAIADLETASPDYDLILKRLRECQTLKKRGGLDSSAIRGLEKRVVELLMEPRPEIANRRTELIAATEGDVVDSIRR